MGRTGGLRRPREGGRGMAGGAGNRRPRGGFGRLGIAVDRLFPNDLIHPGGDIPAERVGGGKRRGLHFIVPQRVV